MTSITKREQEILNYIAENPFITQSDIAEKVGITRSSVAVHIRNLTAKGYIKGRAYIFPEDYYILSVGAASIGYYGKVEGELSSRSHNGLATAGYDGAARNVAEMLKNANINVELMTAIGEDEAGYRMMQDLSLKNISYYHSIRHVDHPSSRELCMMNPTTGQYTSMMDNEILSLLTPDYFAQHEEFIKASRAMYLADCLPEESIQYLTDIYEGPIYTTFRIDENVEKFRSIVSKLKAVVITQDHLEILCERPIVKYRDLRHNVQWLLNKGLKEIYVAMASGGLYYASQETYGKLPSLLEGQIYWTGMGEAFMSGVMAGHLEQRDMKSKAKMALIYAKASSLTPLPVNQEMNAEGVEKLIKQYFPELLDF